MPSLVFSVMVHDTNSIPVSTPAGNSFFGSKVYVGSPMMVGLVIIQPLSKIIDPPLRMLLGVTITNSPPIFSNRLVCSVFMVVIGDGHHSTRLL